MRAADWLRRLHRGCTEVAFRTCNPFNTNGFWAIGPLASHAGGHWFESSSLHQEKKPRNRWYTMVSGFFLAQNRPRNFHDFLQRLAQFSTVMQPFGCTRLHQIRKKNYRPVRYKKYIQDVLDKYVNVCYITINVSEMYVPYNILFI